MGETKVAISAKAGERHDAMTVRGRFVPKILRATTHAGILMWLSQRIGAPP